MWKKVAVLVCGLVLVLGVNAASLNIGELPEGSNWFVHVNVELMRTSTIGQMMMEESLGEAFREIEKETGVQFTDQIEGLTIFGGHLPPNNGAVVAHGGFSADTQSEMIGAMSKAGTYLEGDHLGQRYFAINDLDGDNEKEFGHGSRHDHDDLLYVAFGDDQTLFSQNLDAVKSFLDAGGYLTGLPIADSSTLLVIEADRAMLQGGVNTRVAQEDGNWDSSILANVDSIAAVLVDDNGAASFHADVRAKSPEIAESVRNIVEGLVALKALDSSDEPAIGALLRSTKIRTDGSDITVDVFIDPELLNELIDH
jgi:hypothetical protein